jgi:hypothetical protein
MKLHESKKGGATGIAGLKKMQSVLLLQALYSHLGRHTTVRTEIPLGDLLVPFCLIKILACVAGAFAQLMTDMVILTCRHSP